MNSVSWLFDSPLAYRLGSGLVHFLWQGAIIATVLGVALRLLRQGSANARYVASWIALVAMVACVLVTFCLTDVPSSVPDSTGDVEGVAFDRPSWQGREGTAFERGRDALVPVAGQPDFGVIDVEEGREVETGLVVPMAGPVSRIGSLAEYLGPWWDLVLSWTVSGWLVGIVGLSLWRVGGWLQLRRLRRFGTSAAAHETSQTFERLLERICAGRPVRLLESTLARSPIVIGWLRPVVLLPVSIAAELPPQQLEMILAHELAHIRRWDFFWNLVQTVVETLLFYHPAVWWVSRQIRIEREACCDDMAASVMGDRLLYAQSLAGLEEMRHQQKPQLGSSLQIAADDEALLGRIRRVLGLPSEDCRAGRGWLGGIVALSLVVTALAGYIAIAGEPTNPSAEMAHNETKAATTNSTEQLPHDVAETAVKLELGAPNGLRYQLKSDRESFDDGEAIALAFTLQNITDRPLKMVYRPAVELVDVSNPVTAGGRLIFPRRVELHSEEQAAEVRLVSSVEDDLGRSQQEIARGRWFTQRDFGKNVIVLGHDVATQLFPATMPIGRTLQLEDEDYVVIGKTKPHAPSPAIVHGSPAREYNREAYIPQSHTVPDRGHRIHPFEARVLTIPPRQVVRLGVNLSEYYDLPPGQYAISAHLIAEGEDQKLWWSGQVRTNTVRFAVQRHSVQESDDERGDGKLHWSLSSEGGLVMKADGSDAEPIQLGMCFSNMTGRTVKVDGYAPFLRHVSLEVTGPDKDSVVKVPHDVLLSLPGPDRTGSEFPVLRHGHAYDAPRRWPFPGVFLDPSAKTWKLVRYQLKKPGKYRLRFRYVNPAPVVNRDIESGAAKWSKDCWTGELSNEFDVWVAANYGPVETEEEARSKAREKVTALASEGRIRAADLSVESLGKIQIEKRGEIPLEVLPGENTTVDGEVRVVPHHVPQYFGPDVWLFHCQSETMEGYVCIDARTGNIHWNQLRPPIPAFNEPNPPTDLSAARVVLGDITVGRPSGRLQLGLSIEQPTTTIKPGWDGYAAFENNCQRCTLNLEFRNTGRIPIKLDTYLMTRCHLSFEVIGPKPDSVKTKTHLIPWSLARPRAENFPKLAPGETWTTKLQFPGVFRGKAYGLLQPGDYHIRAVYENGPESLRIPGSEKSYVSRDYMARTLGDVCQGCWRGIAWSNEIALSVLPEDATSSLQEVTGFAGGPLLAKSQVALCRSVYAEYRRLIEEAVEARDKTNIFTRTDEFSGKPEMLLNKFYGREPFKLPTVSYPASVSGTVQASRLGDWVLIETANPADGVRIRMLRRARGVPM